MCFLENYQAEVRRILSNLACLDGERTDQLSTVDMRIRGLLRKFSEDVAFAKMPKFDLDDFSVDAETDGVVSDIFQVPDDLVQGMRKFEKMVAEFKQNILAEN